MAVVVCHIVLGFFIYCYFKILNFSLCSLPSLVLPSEQNCLVLEEPGECGKCDGCIQPSAILVNI